MDWLWIIAIAIAVVFMAGVAADMLRNHMRRQQEPKRCSYYEPCPECEAEPSSNLDRLDGLS